MSVVIADGIGTSLSSEERNALEVLVHLPVDDFNRLKQMMELDVPGVVGRTTLTRFLELCSEQGFDLSDAGVSAFKEKHQLGNTGTLKGVIGPQTAGVYFSEIMASLEDIPVGSASGRINREGLDLVKEFEGLARQNPEFPGQVEAYRDPVGIATIGYGHTGNDVQMGQRISFQRAEELLREDLRESEAQVSALVKVPLTDNEFSALVSFTFNLGAGKLRKSTLLKRLNEGNKAAAANEFLKFVFASKKKLLGLVKRRTAERELFLNA